MDKPYHKIITYEDHLQSLLLACNWIEIKQGRAAQYQQFIMEFYEEDNRSREHILAYNESCEITDIYDLWEPIIDNFPGLKRKIKKVFQKGPILQEDERPDTSTNRSRNDAFVYLLAGKLIKAGVNVIAIDGVIARGYTCYHDADITFDWQGSPVDIECKRPQSEQAITKRVKEARQQLKRGGIIALECSVFVRQPEHLIEADSVSKAEEMLGYFLENKVKKKVEAHLDKGILGFFVFARAPAMIRIGYSPILSQRGNHIVHMRRECISTWLVILDPTSPNIEILRSVYLLLQQAIHTQE